MAIEIKHVERYTIPLGDREYLQGVTVADLLAGLSRLPAGGRVSQDYNGHNLFVTFENKPIQA